MLALLTSCDRHDLLQVTINSLSEKQQYPINLVINEDSIIAVTVSGNYSVTHTLGIGQHHAIEQCLLNQLDKYYLHLEDDWLFENTYDWISESVKIMEADPTVIKVLCRNGSPHPCTHDRVTKSGIAYGILEPWQNDSITWCGFSWNPGVTRLDLLQQFIPFRDREESLAASIHLAGYRIAELSIPIYTHIGDGRSTPR